MGRRRRLTKEVVINTSFNPTTLAKDNFACTKIANFLKNDVHVGIGMVRDVIKSISQNQKKLAEFKYPLLIFHGNKNMAINHKDIFKAVKTIGSNDKTLKIVENGYIELYCDLEKEALGVTMMDWVLKRLKKAPVLGNLSHYKFKSGPPKARLLNWPNVIILLSYLVCLKKLSHNPYYNSNRLKLLLFPIYILFKLCTVVFKQQYKFVSEYIYQFKKSILL